MQVVGCWLALPNSPLPPSVSLDCLVFAILFLFSFIVLHVMIRTNGAVGLHFRLYTRGGGNLVMVGKWVLGPQLGSGQGAGQPADPALPLRVRAAWSGPVSEAYY